MLDTKDCPYNELIKPAPYKLDLPLFCQFFEFVRTSHNISVDDLAHHLGIKKEYIDNLENGFLWGNIQHIDLLKVERFFNLKKGCLKKYLKQTLSI
jgi:transcriptional regulator with XRE-family HTH domain